MARINHHAYYIEGALTQFDGYRKELKPYWSKKFGQLGIEEVRALVTLATLKNIGETTYFVAAGAITSEAQQALLKLFEEPQEGTTFVLLVPHGALLPTLRSRMLKFEFVESPPQETRHSSAGSPPRVETAHAARIKTPLQGGARHIPRGELSTSLDVVSFLAAAQRERSDYIAKLLKDDEDTRERARDFVNALECELYRKIENPAARRGLEDIVTVRGYLGDRSPSLKMLLEHLSVSLPIVE